MAFWQQSCWCCANKQCKFKYNYEWRDRCLRCGKDEGGPSQRVVQPRGVWAGGISPSVRAPKPKGPPPLTDAQVRAYAAMDPAAHEAVADTLSQSARDRIQHQRGLLSGDPQLVSRAAQKESDVLTDRLGKVQKKYDKAQENLHRAVRWAAEVGAELEELQQQQKEAAARGAAALARVGGTAAAAPGTPPGQCDGLPQQARLLGDAELEAKLTEVAAQLTIAQQELQAKAAQ
ncbi:unnamed protein product, partial [Prorocentrum cordatum]